VEYSHKHGFNSIRHPCLESSFTKVYKDYIYKNVRIVRKLAGLKSCWGGDDFQINGPGSPRKGYTSHNVPPELEMEIPYYHFHRQFPKNNPRADERIATEIAPRQDERKKAFERSKNFLWDKFQPPSQEELLDSLPALLKGLSQELEYKVREELFDKKWLSKTTNLVYK